MLVVSAAVVGVTCRALTAMLIASSTKWLPGDHGSVNPVLNRIGTVARHDVSALPVRVEVPSKVGTQEFGRFIVRSNRHDTSREELTSAPALVDVFARFMPDQEVPPPLVISNG